MAIDSVILRIIDVRDGKILTDAAWMPDAADLSKATLESVEPPNLFGILDRLLRRTRNTGVHKSNWRLEISRVARYFLHMQEASGWHETTVTRDVDGVPWDCYRGFLIDVTDGP